VYDRVVGGTINKTEALATATAPSVTGFLKNNRSKDFDAGPGSLKGTLTYHAFYALWVMRGTGIYGPHGTPIVPVTSKYLVFRGKDGSTVFAKSVKGQTANQFLTEAFRAGAAPWPVTIHRR
jgi:hypothetical protein